MNKVKETLTSRKFWGCVGVAAIAVAKDQGIITPPCALELQVALGGYVGTQLVMDHGKQKAAVETGAIRG